MMTRWQFETALRTLVNPDMQELVDAGVIADRDYEARDAFHADPVTRFLTRLAPLLSFGELPHLPRVVELKLGSAGHPVHAPGPRTIGAIA